MIAISVIRGTFVSTVRPVANSAAAISFSAEFFAPTTETSPASRAPPATLMMSTAAIVGISVSARRLVVMPVHLTRIYTKAGDTGTTALTDGSRVPKTHPRITAYADVDECNAAIGVALALGNLADDVRDVLVQVQNDLFDAGADLSMPVEPDAEYPRLTETYVTRLEAWCDEFNGRLSKLDSFILPGGTPGAALLHVGRTVARRAERSAWALVEADPDRTNTLAPKYLNRLSDLLFILARVANPDGDVKWVPGGTTPR